MPYLSRFGCGAVPPVRTVPVSKRLKGVCLHYMGFLVRAENPVRLVQSIQRGHMAEQKNWWDIAYNELIGDRGRQGIGSRTTSAHQWPVCGQ